MVGFTATVNDANPSTTVFATKRRFILEFERIEMQLNSRFIQCFAMQFASPFLTMQSVLAFRKRFLLLFALHPTKN